MISVIIPTFNRAAFLSKALQSVCGQSMNCDELIIVDDGSTDETAECVEQFARLAEHPVRYYFQKNRGASSARNHGIREARGNILCFLDSDDWWDERKIELQWADFQQQNVSLISHTREIWYRHGVRVNQKKKHAPPHGEIFSRCLSMCVVGMSTVMVRREFFDRYGLFDESLPCCEDYDLWLRASYREPFHLVDKPLTLKDGGRPDQLSSLHGQGMDIYRIQAICKLLDADVLNEEQRSCALAELTKKCSIYGHGCIRHGRREEGETVLALVERYGAGVRSTLLAKARVQCS